jgi:hypothetical protein
MKLLLTIYFTLWGVAFPQERSEQLSINVLLEKRDKFTTMVVTDFLEALGNVDDFDLIAVVFGDRIDLASIIGLKGVGTGIVYPDTRPNDDFLEVVYLSSNMIKSNADPKQKKTMRFSPGKYEKIVKCAWELALDQELGVQSKNLEGKYLEIKQFYFFVSSRINEKPSKKIMLLGGYLANPKRETKTGRFFGMIEEIVNEVRNKSQQ